jgi:hypothetical protein
MPSLPDIPGKSLIKGVTDRTRGVAAAAGSGALAAGDFVAKRVLRHGGGDGGDDRANADPIAETPTAPPGAEEKPVPKPKAAKQRPAKQKAQPKAKPAVADSGSKPAKPKAPPKPKAKPAPKAKAGGKDPHHALNNPVGEPDLTEYPDPFETRADPLDPVDPDDAPFGEEPHPQTGAESTSEPPLSQDPELPGGGKPPQRENLDD